MRSGNDAEIGIYRKFTVARTDGSSGPGGKHEHCRYFVLDIDHDEYAIPALREYALRCRERFPFLSDDLEKIVNEAGCSTLNIHEEGTPGMCKSPRCRAKILWRPLGKEGKLHPFNPDGTSHFSSCPDAASFRRSKDGAA